MVHCDHDCGLVECDVFDTLIHIIAPNFDIQVDVLDIVDQVANIADRLQLLHDYGLIQPLLQSRWYLLHMDR